MPDFTAPSLQRARERFNGAPCCDIELPSGTKTVPTIVWEDTEQVTDDFENEVSENVIRLNFLRSDVGAVPKDTKVTMGSPDSRVFLTGGSPVRQRDHEVRYEARLISG